MEANCNRIFCTSIISETLIKKYNLSFAACNFSFNLINGQIFNAVYSIMPSYVKEIVDENAYGDCRYKLVYDNWRHNKCSLLRKLSIIKEQWSIYKLIPANSNLWLYNLNILNVFLFIFIKILKPSVKLYIIVLDYTPSNKKIGFAKLCLKLINLADGRVCLANSQLFNKNNSAILPGVIPNNGDLEQIPRIKTPQKKFLLSGVLSEGIAQLSMILEIFSKMPLNELYITGTNGDEKLINYYTSRFKNIHYFGQLPFNEYINILHTITYQLSTRNPEYPENQCNFPSKIIEALFHNRIIISTINYPQLNNIRYFKVSSNKDILYKQIIEITQIPETELLKYSNQGLIVAKMFNVNVWRSTMEKIESYKR